MEDIEAEDHEAAKKAEEAGNMSPSSPMRSKRQQNAMLSSRYMMVQIRSQAALCLSPPIFAHTVFSPSLVASAIQKKRILK